MLKRSPKGFEEDNPAIHFLRMKGFYTQKKLTDQEILEGQTLKKVIDSFILSKPLVDFLNKAIEFE